jgi:hypothetical protein
LSPFRVPPLAAAQRDERHTKNVSTRPHADTLFASQEESLMMNKTLLAALGVGLMIAAGNVGCGSPPPSKAPDLSSGAETTGAPTKDTDGDGVPDSLDKCPDQKEDGALPEPKDGCPNAPKPKN